jgi:hypothetical protein
MLHYFGLDCGMLEFLQIFFSQAVIQRTKADFTAFLETSLSEKISVCVHATRVPNKKKEKRHFCQKRLKYSKLKLKNQKPIAAEVISVVNVNKTPALNVLYNLHSAIQYTCHL